MKSLSINRPIKIRCEFCNNAFSSLENLEVHKKVEHSEKLKKPSGWKCPVNFCGAQFLNRESLNLHTLKIHPNGIKESRAISKNKSHDHCLISHNSVNDDDSYIFSVFVTNTDSRYCRIESIFV